MATYRPQRYTSPHPTVPAWPPGLGPYRFLKPVPAAALAVSHQADRSAPLCVASRTFRYREFPTSLAKSRDQPTTLRLWLKLPCNVSPNYQVALGLDALSSIEPYFRAGRQIAHEFVKLSGV